MAPYLLEGGQVLFCAVSPDSQLWVLVTCNKERAARCNLFILQSAQQRSGTAEGPIDVTRQQDGERW